MLVDSHIRVWDRHHTPQPWMTDEHRPIARPFRATDVAPLLERKGIDSVILVQGACLDSDADYLFEQTARNEWIGAVTAWVRLEDPDRAAGRLDELQRRPKLCAIRHLTHNEPDHWIVGAARARIHRHTRGAGAQPRGPGRVPRALR